VHDLLRVSGDIEVLAIAGDGAASEATLEPVAAAARDRGAVVAWSAALIAVGLAVLVALPLRPHLEPANLTLPFLLAVVSIALLGRRGPVILTTVLGVVIFDLVCVPPYGSFAVSDTEYLLTFTGMLVVGLTIAHLVARLRRQIDQALDEAEGAAALHRLGSGLATTRGLDQVVHTAATLTGDILGCRATVLVTDAPGSSSLSQEALLRLADDTDAITPADLAVAQWVARNGQPAGLGTDTLPAAAGLHLPLAITGGATGVLVLAGLSATRSRDPAWRRLAEAAARLTALAIGCERLYLQAAESQQQADHAQLRATLLAGVSHDLRTPLTAISGLAQQLADDPDPERRQTALTIAEQAERLATTVRNLLDLTRLGSGSVRPRRVALAAEDAIATAIASVRPRAHGRTFTVTADDCPAVAADETLLHTALVNLLDNALVHTSGPIEVAAQAVPQGIAITVADRGPGIPPAERERIFEAWQRGTGAVPGGAGLGLALVRAIAQAHGGRIEVEDRAGGGAVFRLTMPRHADT
jgi:two-component system sensor histidine kinase KdpD